MASYFGVSLDYLTGAGIYKNEEEVLEHRKEIQKRISEVADTYQRPFKEDGVWKAIDTSQFDLWSDDVFLLIISLMIKEIYFDHDKKKILIAWRA